jgi:phosphoglycerate dehydrogenase-like enzyme
MRILAYDPFAPQSAFEELGAEPTPLEALLASSDFVTLHCALSADTRHLINGEALRRMRPDAYLINCARGALVDESALAEALAEGRIAGAGVDAFDLEPLPPDHPFRRLPNCLSTPHNAWNTRETLARTNQIVVDAVLALLRGERPTGVVNVAVYDSGRLRATGNLLSEA